MTDHSLWSSNSTYQPVASMKNADVALLYTTLVYIGLDSKLIQSCLVSFVEKNNICSLFSHDTTLPHMGSYVSLLSSH